MGKRCLCFFLVLFVFKISSGQKNQFIENEDSIIHMAANSIINKILAFEHDDYSDISIVVEINCKMTRKHIKTLIYTDCFYYEKNDNVLREIVPNHFRYMVYKTKNYKKTIYEFNKTTNLDDFLYRHEFKRTGRKILDIIAPKIKTIIYNKGLDANLDIYNCCFALIFKNVNYDDSASEEDQRPDILRSLILER